MVSIAPRGLSGPAAPRAGKAGLALAGLGALGIVFGDIGTSPLYTLKTVFDYLDGGVTPDRILGILSLVIWTCSLLRP
jgi:KUP system potassium uptake protein